jgi:hypothetical protein
MPARRALSAFATLDTDTECLSRYLQGSPISVVDTQQNTSDQNA